MNLRAFLGGVAAVDPHMPIADALRLYDDRVAGEPGTVTISPVDAAEDAVDAIRDRLDAEDGR